MALPCLYSSSSAFTSRSSSAPEWTAWLDAPEDFDVMLRMERAGDESSGLPANSCSVSRSPLAATPHISSIRSRSRPFAIARSIGDLSF